MFLSSYDVISVPLESGIFISVVNVLSIMFLLIALALFLATFSVGLVLDPKTYWPLPAKILMGFTIFFSVPGLVFAFIGIQHQEHAVHDALNEMGLELVKGDKDEITDRTPLTAYSAAADCEVIVTYDGGSLVTNGECLDGSGKIPDVRAGVGG